MDIPNETDSPRPREILLIPWPAAMAPPERCSVCGCTTVNVVTRLCGDCELRVVEVQP
jgi:hypothetical protein